MEFSRSLVNLRVLFVTLPAVSAAFPATSPARFAASPATSPAVFAALLATLPAVFAAPDAALPAALAVLLTALPSAADAEGGASGARAKSAAAARAATGAWNIWLILRRGPEKWYSRPATSTQGVAAASLRVNSLACGIFAESTAATAT